MRKPSRHRRSPVHQTLIVGLFLGLLQTMLCPATAQSQTRTASDQLHEFHIPAGPLDRSIAAFTRQTHASVLYDAGLIENRDVPPVNGFYSYASALDALLNGTGIVARYVDGRSFVLVETKKAGGDAAGPGNREASIRLETLHVDAPADFLFYSSILAADLQRALSRKASLRSLTLLVKANLWVDDTGRVEHAELSHSTGDKGRDDNVVRALGEFSASKPPPEGLPQPILVAIDFRRL